MLLFDTEFFSFPSVWDCARTQIHNLNQSNKYPIKPSIATREGSTEAIKEEIVAYIANLWRIWIKTMLASLKVLFPIRNLSF